MDKFYNGERESGNCMVKKANGDELPLRLDLRNHSPTGFNWGYGGSGPAQLALALLADYFKDDEKALEYYQTFKWDIIAGFKSNAWKITTSEIENWLLKQQKMKQ